MCVNVNKDCLYCSENVGSLDYNGSCGCEDTFIVNESCDDDFLENYSSIVERVIYGEVPLTDCIFNNVDDALESKRVRNIL